MLQGMFNGLKLREKALETAWLRNDVIAQNIANVDTPGYKKKSVAFEELLNNAMTDAYQAHEYATGEYLNVTPTVVEDNSSLSYRLDGNNVDFESEAAAMAKNAIKYYALSQSVGGYFSKLKSVINGGSR